MQKVHVDRLLRLAAHLHGGKLGHEVFSIRAYNVDRQGRGVPHACGYSGCAIGECPIVFPGEWIFDKNGDPKLARSKDSTTSEDARLWFGLEVAEFHHLFYSWSQCPEKFGGSHLDQTAGADAVATNIDAFINMHLSKTINP